MKKSNSAGKNAKSKKNNGLIWVAAAAVILCLAVVVFKGLGETKTTSKNGASDGISEGALVVDQTANQTEVQNANQDASQVDEQAAAQVDEQAADQESVEATVIPEGGSLVIPVADLSTDASFFPVEVDGTKMEVIAVKDSDGNIRTAFNTCQICYGSGRGYYVQQGDMLVCQNCGNRFTIDQVEVESGGCNPWPIFEDNKTVTEDSIEISYEYLAEARQIFGNWKASY